MIVVALMKQFSISVKLHLVVCNMNLGSTVSVIL